MATYTVVAAEDGLESPLGVYDATADPMVLGTLATGRVGVRFTGLPYTTFTDSGVFGASPIVGRSQANTVLKGVTVRVQVNPSDLGGLFSLFFSDEQNPAVFSGANLVSGKPFVLLAQHTFTALGAQTLNMVASSTGLAGISYRQRAVGWTGALAFLFTYIGVGTVTITSADSGANGPTLLTEELPYVTGVVGHHRAHSRIDRCPRCGRLQPRELFVRDGFVRNLLVCQRCYDEPDLVHKTGIRPGREKPGINN